MIHVGILACEIVQFFPTKILSARGLCCVNFYATFCCYSSAKRLENSTTDATFNQMIPLESWGKRFAVVPFQPGVAFRLIIVANLTCTMYIGQQEVLVLGMEIFTYDVEDGEHLIVSSTEPVMMTQLSLDEDANHSPASFVVTPIDRYLSTYTIPIPHSVTDNLNFFTQVFLIYDSKTVSFLINGFSFSLTGQPTYQFIGPTGDLIDLYSYRLPFSRPACKISSESGQPFGFIVYSSGLGGKCSYAFTVYPLQNASSVTSQTVETVTSFSETVATAAATSKFETTRNQTTTNPINQATPNLVQRRKIVKQKSVEPIDSTKNWVLLVIVLTVALVVVVVCVTLRRRGSGDSVHQGVPPTARRR